VAASSVRFTRRNRGTCASGDGILAIRQALEQLPENLRTLLWLREVEGYSYDELARILKIPDGTVRSRLHSARQQLRTVWMEDSDDLHRG